MSISNNTTKLQNLMDKINALPEAGSSSGGSVETCTVKVIYDLDTNESEDMRPVGVYTKFIDNVISSGCDMGSKFEKYQYIGNDGNTHNYAIDTYVNVVCNTFMIINDSASAELSVMNGYVFSGNAENVTFASNDIINTFLPEHAEVFQINGDCTIILPDSDYGFTEDKII